MECARVHAGAKGKRSITPGRSSPFVTRPSEVLDDGVACAKGAVRTKCEGAFRVAWVLHAPAVLNQHFLATDGDVRRAHLEPRQARRHGTTDARRVIARVVPDRRGPSRRGIVGIENVDE